MDSITITNQTPITSLTSTPISPLTTAQLASLTSSTYQQSVLGSPNSASSQVYTTNNTGGYGGYTFQQNPWQSPNITLSQNTNLNGSQLSIKGDADIDGDLIVKGKSILTSLEKIEERLAIYKSNPELEEKWDELRDLANKYKELEKEIIEKEKMWDILKK
jgi:hypothetical protein